MSESKHVNVEAVDHDMRLKWEVYKAFFIALNDQDRNKLGTYNDLEHDGIIHKNKTEALEVLNKLMQGTDFKEIVHDKLGGKNENSEIKTNLLQHIMRHIEKDQGYDNLLAKQGAEILKEEWNTLSDRAKEFYTPLIEQQEGTLVAIQPLDTDTN